MKKEVTLVPKDKCPLDVLAEMEERTANAWIFLHDNVVENLQKSCDEYHLLYRGIRLKWNATKNVPDTSVLINRDILGGVHWNFVYFIDADNIAFNYRSFNPDELIFLQMEE